MNTFSLGVLNFLDGMGVLTGASNKRVARRAGEALYELELMICKSNETGWNYKLRSLRTFGRTMHRIRGIL